MARPRSGSETSRREFIKTLGLGAGAAALGGLSACSGGRRLFGDGERKGMPNVVFIMADDLGWRDTGVYGSTFYNTPHIDALAKRGISEAVMRQYGVAFFDRLVANKHRKEWRCWENAWIMPISTKF